DADRERLAIVPNDFPGAAAAMLAQEELLARFSGLCPNFDPARVRADLRTAAAAGPLLVWLAYGSRALSDRRRPPPPPAVTATPPVYKAGRDLAKKAADSLPLVRPIARLYAPRIATRRANAKAKAASTPKPPRS